LLDLLTFLSLRFLPDFLPFDYKFMEKQDHQLPITKGSYTNYPKSKNTSIYYAIFLEILILYGIVTNYQQLYEHSEYLAGVCLGSFSTLFSQSISQLYRQSFSFDKHFKFFLWGCINSLISNFWIGILLHSLDNNIHRFLLDQTVGVLTGQLIFVFFNAFWESSLNYASLKSTYLTCLRYSYMIWPLVSFLSFFHLHEDYIFPLNCFVTLIWNIILAMIS